MKVAFASEDLVTVDAHFGLARHLVVYEISPDGHTLAEVHRFRGDLEDGNDDKLGPRIEAIRDCAILYVAAIGGPGAARVVARRIHPVKVSEPAPIAEILAKLQAVLAGAPPPWLRKAMANPPEPAPAGPEA